MPIKAYNTDLADQVFSDNLVPRKGIRFIRREMSSLVKHAYTISEAAALLGINEAKVSRHVPCNGGYVLRKDLSDAMGPPPAPQPEKPRVEKPEPVPEPKAVAKKKPGPKKVKGKRGKGRGKK